MNSRLPSSAHDQTVSLLSSEGLNIGDYLIRKLQEYKIQHIFGIPGDYVLGFYDMLQNSAIKVIGTTKEDGAGFAADAYARVNGMGACCVTYSVGGLSIANAIAGAYAERSPVVVITGSPGLGERAHDPMLHHKVRSFNTQADIFSQITELAVVLDDAETALSLIDQAFWTCFYYKRPVYIEIPRDMVNVVPTRRYRHTALARATNMDALDEALAEIGKLLREAKQPVILADVEIQRYGLQDELAEFVNRTGIPIAATLLGKSVIEETHPRYLGIYEGAMGRDEVTRYVEKSDCILAFGAVMTDINLGIFTANLDVKKIIQVRSDLIQIRHHRYVDISFEDIFYALSRLELPVCTLPVSPPCIPVLGAPSTSALKVDQLFARLNTLLDREMAVVCDVGLCLFGAIDLVISSKTDFVAPAYYTSMGFGVPASLGVISAKPSVRTVVLVGDGAFQMTGLELSTSVRLGHNPIVIVLNNKGYTTERAIMDGPYNDILSWDLLKLPELLGGGRAWKVSTEQQFTEAWQEARANTTCFSLISVELDAHDYCPALERLGKHLAARIC